MEPVHLPIRVGNGNIIFSVRSGTVPPTHGGRCRRDR